MDKKQISIAAASAAFLLAAALVTASTQTANTPLYTIRMEQASSKMNFLPAAVNEFTYDTESGYNLVYGALGCRVDPVALTEIPCYLTDVTCVKTACLSCSTCGSTCGYTCGCTCGFTCDTCVATCGNTCNPTCNAITCDSCIDTCITCSSCSLTCSTC